MTTPASHPISSRDGGSISPQRARGQAEAKAGNARTRSREKAGELEAAKEALKRSQEEKDAAPAQKMVALGIQYDLIKMTRKITDKRRADIKADLIAARTSNSTG